MGDKRFCGSVGFLRTVHTEAAIETNVDYRSFCVLDIGRVNVNKPEYINEIVVDTTSTALGFAVGQSEKSLRLTGPLISNRRSQAQLQKRITNLEHYTEEFIKDPKITTLIDEIWLTVTMPLDKPLGVRLKIRMERGNEYRKLLTCPKVTTHLPSPRRG